MGVVIDGCGVEWGWGCKRKWQRPDGECVVTWGYTACHYYGWIVQAPMCFGGLIDSSLMIFCS